MERGYKHCDFLPLGTDTNIFHPKQMKKPYNVSFVGSSMAYTIHKNMKSWCHRSDLITAFPVVVERVINSKSRHVEPSLDALSLHFDSISQKEDYKAAVLWKGTQEYRKSGLDKLSSFITTISGDPNWINIMPEEYEIISERWYYDNLCDFYNQSTINFNMTSLQMVNAVNQRVFDVSACKGFLITDFKPQIADFFVTKDNLAWFNSVEEIPDLIDFYLKNEALRDKLADKAYEIVTKHHTYDHRIIKLIEIIKKRYK
jgi:spore maturation protein CgeB